MLVRITVPMAPKLDEFGRAVGENTGASTDIEFKHVVALIMDALGIANKQIQSHIGSIWWQQKHNQQKTMSTVKRVASSINDHYGEAVYDVELNTAVDKKLNWENWIVGIEKDFRLFPEENGSVMNYSWTVQTDIADLTHTKGDGAIVVIWK